MRSASAPVRGGPARAVAAAALALMLGSALVALRQEWQVFGASQKAERALEHPLAPRLAPNPDSLPPRAALFEALAAGRAANATREPDARRTRFALADALVARALGARERWGTARAVQAYLFALRLGASAPATQAAYARSYAEGRFLPDAASWRIRYGLDQWPQLDPLTRQRLIDEMAWYASVSKTGYFSTVLAAIGTPAEVPFMRARARLVHARQDGQAIDQ